MYREVLYLPKAGTWQEARHMLIDPSDLGRPKLVRLWLPTYYLVPT